MSPLVKLETLAPSVGYATLPGLQEITLFTVAGSQDLGQSESGVCMILVVGECHNALYYCIKIKKMFNTACLRG